MGQGERENAATLSEKIKSLMFAVGRFPSIRANDDAMAALALIRADFECFVSRFVRQEGNPNG